MSFTLSGGRPTVEVSASAAIVSETATSATIRVTANSWMVYSGSSVKSSGVYANITINGTSSGAKRIFGDCYPDSVSGTSTHSITYDVTVTKGAAKSVSWSAAFHSYVDGTDLGVKDTKSGSVSVGAATYTISFNANGSGQSNTTQSVAHGVSTAIKGASTFSRTGYTLSSWNTAADGSGTSYTTGGSYSFTGNKTLYAQWEANTYTVSFNTNGGVPVPDSADVTYDSIYGSVLNTMVKKTGYSFEGWFSASTGGTQLFASNFVTTTSDHTVYARWKPIEYTISYDKNGGKNGVVETSSHVYDTAKKITKNEYTKPGYNFIGWSYEADSRAWAALYDEKYLVFGSGDSAPLSYNDFELTEEWSYNSGEIDINSLVSINAGSNLPWYSYREAIVKVDVIDIIHPIDMSYWFYGFTNCVQMILYNIDTSLVSSMAMMCAMCTSLTAENSFLASGWNVSNCREFKYMFYGCSGIVDLTSLVTWRPKKLEDASCMFYGCSSIPYLDLTDWDMSTCKNFGHMFRGCTSLLSPGLLDNWGMDSAKTVYSMFERCNAMTHVGDLSNWNVSNIENFNYMFNRCNALPTIGDISTWDTSSATGMRAMFQFCTMLSVDCSSWNVSNVTIYNAFNYESYNVLSPAFGSKARMLSAGGDFTITDTDGEVITIDEIISEWEGSPDIHKLFADEAEVLNLTSVDGKNLILYAQWEPAASLLNLYFADGKKRGMTHMYNDAGRLCYAIMTIYDENRIGHFTN